MIVALAVVLVGCGEEDAEEERSSSTKVTVCEAADPKDQLGEVKVSGAAYAPARRGFVLSDGGCSIFVAVSPKEAVQARGGSRVLVRGRMDSMNGVEVGIIRRLLREAAGDLDRNGAIARRAPAGPGAPFVDAFSLRGEDLVPPEG